MVHFTQAAALEQAQALMSHEHVHPRQEKDAIAELIGDFRFASGFGKTLSRLVRHGIGVHHAGMLPKYRRLVETLAQAGCSRSSAAPTRSASASTCRSARSCSPRWPSTTARRPGCCRPASSTRSPAAPGRAGFDTAGRVVVQAPEHVIENERSYAKILAKAGGDDAHARRRVVKKKPPEGTISWGKPTFERLVAAEPEPLTSRFTVTHAMVLNVIDRPGNAYRR